MIDCVGCTICGGVHEGRVTSDERAERLYTDARCGTQEEEVRWFDRMSASFYADTCRSVLPRKGQCDEGS